MQLMHKISRNNKIQKKTAHKYDVDNLSFDIREEKHKITMTIL